MQTASQSLTAGGACLLQPTRSGARRADRLVAWVDSYEGSWDASTMRVSEIWIPSGAKPGHAIIEIKKAVGSRKANRVAFRQPWEALQIGQRVVIAKATSAGTLKRFWCGSVVDPSCDIGKDAITITALDDRWLMQDIRIVGRHIVIPTTGVLFWQQGWPAEFNAGGRPNMLISVTKSEGVAIPGFAPYPDYGLAPGTEPSSTPSQTVASYWTLAWIFRYLHYACGPYALKDAQGNPTTDTRFIGHKAPKTCPSVVAWSPGIGTWLDTEDVAWFDFGRGQGKAQASGTARKGRSISGDGYALLDFMELLLSTAGGYTLGWMMQGEQGNDGKQQASSRLNVVRSVGKGGGGATIYVLRGGNVEGLQDKSRYWTGGTYHEDGRDIVTRAMGLGSLAKVERRLDTYVTLALKKRWSAAEETALRTRGGAIPVGTAAGVRALFSEFPNVWAAWKLDETYDFTVGTSEASLPHAAVPRPMMPYLLSWIGTIAYDYVAQRYPIRLEISTDSGSTWATTTELTGLEVLDDGTIFIPSLRELPLGGQPGSWRWTGAPYSWGAGAIASTEIRATFAIPFDHRLAAVCKLINSELPEFDDIYRTPDLNRISRGLDRQDVLDLRGLYDLWLRKDSWPVPESQKSAKSDDKATRELALRNDTALLRSHIRRHMVFASRPSRVGSFFSKRGCIDTSILELGKEYSAVGSITETGVVSTPITAVRSGLKYIVARGYLETQMHLG